MASFHIGPITINNEDVLALFNASRKTFNKAKTKILRNLPKKLSVCLIDDRYNKTGYINQTGVICVSEKALEELENIDVCCKNHFRPDLGLTLKDIFDSKILLECSNELTGYEDLDINSFDVVIKV